MNKTKIEWSLNQDGTPGFTSNPVRGECPVGCSYCYVKSFRARYGWHKDIRFYPEELNKIVCRKKPAGIFLGSTIELFHDKASQYMPCIMDAIKASPQHRFYLLTKCPQNLIEFSPFPDNCWVGVTVTDLNSMVKACALLYVKARVKFISFEPLLGDIDGALWPEPSKATKNTFTPDWLIIGSQTKPYRPPKIEWVREIVEAADKAGVPVFLKNNLMPLFEFPVPRLFKKKFPAGRLELRQEMPL